MEGEKDLIAEEARGAVNLALGAAEVALML